LQNPEQRLTANQLQEIIEVKVFQIQIVLSKKKAINLFKNCVFVFSNTKNSRSFSAENLPKTFLDENFQKEIEREREEKERLQRENDEMKNKLAQLAIEPSSSNFKVN
jgi:hypothetical protein